jgi:hypothetical protein
LVKFPGRCLVAQGLGGARQPKDGIWKVWCSQQGFLKVEYRFRRSIEVEQEIPGEFSCRNDGIGRLGQIVDRVVNRDRFFQPRYCIVGVARKDTGSTNIRSRAELRARCEMEASKARFSCGLPVATCWMVTLNPPIRSIRASRVLLTMQRATDKDVLRRCSLTRRKTSLLQLRHS